MKLPQAHYQTITHILKENGFDVTSDVNLVKRKGRIRIELAGKTTFFEFFRRKSVQINEETHRWEKSEHFEIKTEHQVFMVGDWQELFSKLSEWTEKANK